jgi:excisionase family DNA binding protein
MTVAEAARLLEVSPDLVYRLCRAGRLGHRRIGIRRGVIRIDPSDVEAFRAASRVEADAADEPDGRIVQTGRGGVRLPGILDELLARDRARGLRKRST